MIRGCLLQVTKSSDRRLTHLTKASEELVKLEDEVRKFKTWMTAADGELARQEECLRRFEDLKPLAEKQKVRLWVWSGVLCLCVELPWEIWVSVVVYLFFTCVMSTD